MDRNTVIGLVIIGLILSVFTIFNKPSEEELKAQELKAQQEQQKLEEEAQDLEEKAEENEPVNSLVAKLDEKGNQIENEEGFLLYTDTITGNDTLIAQEIPAQEEHVAETKPVIEGEIIE